MVTSVRSVFERGENLAQNGIFIYTTYNDFSDEKATFLKEASV